ncbi:MAG: AAA family ATPase [Candidatus Omnitrophica bacterium]|nr:AAA family ATPase [Candidatus Omnitrophota bacterium]
MWRKLLIFMQLYWIRTILISAFMTMIIWMIQFMLVSNANYDQLESFSRRNLSAQIGQSLIMFIFVTIVQLPLTFGIYYWIMSGGAAGKLGALDLKKTRVNIKMSDVIGMDEPKREAWELVKLLKDRAMVKRIGGKIIKGTIMFGPPGCGKTYLAKAIATEAGLPFLSAVGSEFVAMFVGQGAARMKSLFKQARTLASMEGGCIIFIDEIDSFARPRMADTTGWGGQSSHNATINQFLTELDGLRKTENNIVVLAATNVSESDLDEAMMRAGRFERKIYVSRPNLKERKEVFDFYLKRVETAPEANINTELLAQKTLWFSPADIDYMVREASILALRDKRDQITMKDLNTAYDRVAFGMKSNVILTEKEKVWTAYHEAGHALIAYLTHPTNDVIKATIIPHRGALGFVSQRPTEELHSSNREHLLANIKVALGSYAAETIKFGTTSSGVGGGPGSDFDSAMRTAHSMVWSLGMGKSGLIGDFHSLTKNNMVLISEKTKETLDHDVQVILQSCLKEVTAILNDKRELLDTFAQELMAKSELEYEEIEAIFQKFNAKPASRPTV